MKQNQVPTSNGIGCPHGPEYASVERIKAVLSLQAMKNRFDFTWILGLIPSVDFWCLLTGSKNEARVRHPSTHQERGSKAAAGNPNHLPG